MNTHQNGFFDQRAVPPSSSSAAIDEGPMVIMAGVAAAARRRAVPLAAWVLLCLAAAAWYLHVTPPSYTATATMILDPKRAATPMGETAAAVLPPVLDSAAAESQIQVIRSERLLSSVFDALDLADAPSLRPGPPGLKARVVDAVAGLFRAPHSAVDDKAARDAAAFDAFTGRVGARRIGQSYVVEVAYTSGDPTEARRLANAVVSGYLGQQVSFKLAAAQNGAEYLQGRVKALGDEVRVANAGILAGTVPATLLPDADARVIGAALEPLGRSAPKSGLVVGFAAVFGLLFGLFAVAVLNGLDRRVRSTDQLERATGLPCLGSIPDIRRRKGFAKRPLGEMARLARREPDGRFAAAMRDTRTSILLALEGKRGHALGVTSWAEGAGRSLVAANLAGVVALSGSPVTLVDADIHRADGGLTALGTPVARSLTESLLDPTGATPPDTVRFDEHLGLVPARSAGGAGGFDAYLGAPGLPRLVEGWRTQGDVVVDLPALASGGDARAAAARLDGVVIVVEAGRTTTDDVERAVNALSRAGATVVGTILNRAVG
ncbi:lipopolysaccharide biosynthesis protein [Lichenibacterium minor]|uniref:Lipopolysaccharide biosynthesis protein n=1 Tax=Lichenibacterium minor TaxID=2316528 RepID=A0A4Q2TZB3_9HYPH|nr:Wzz/FepE/Etk N-terminal domain-containing protein [Lichenibacterium minor]RYC29463.1 lipopolysaccharide biosynthesis protein [Lichenibacterium minor]